MPVTISHDAFTRTELTRYTLRELHYSPDARPICRWCGQPAKFGYMGRRDDNNRPPLFGTLNVFCSIVCFRTFS